MNIENKNKIFQTLSACIYALIGAYIAGIASQEISQSFVRFGINFPLREPLNLLIAICIFIIYRKLSKNQIMPTPLGGIKAIFFGIIIMICVLIIAWWFLYFTNHIINIQLKPNIKELYIEILLGLILIIFHGLAEQWLIQSIAQGISSRNYSRFFGIIIGGLVFTALQYIQGYNLIINIFNSFAIGILMASMSNIWGLLAAGFAHGIWSFIEVITIPNIYKFHVKHDFLWQIGNDTYGSIVFGIICIGFTLLINQMNNRLAIRNKGVI